MLIISFIILGVILFFIDFYIKNLIESNSKVIDNFNKTNIFKGKLKIKLHHNFGLPFNLFDKFTKYITMISIFVIGIVTLVFIKTLKTNNILKKLSITLILSGGINNLYDRLKRGYVIDYFIINIKFLKRIIFNISDFLIIIGSIIYFCIQIFNISK